MHSTTVHVTDYSHSVLFGDKRKFIKDQACSGRIIPSQNMGRSTKSILCSCEYSAELDSARYVRALQI